MQNKIWVVATGAALILVGFQNCSKTEFRSTAGAALAKDSTNSSSSTLVPVEDIGEPSATHDLIGNVNIPSPEIAGKKCDSDKDKQDENHGFSGQEENHDHDKGNACEGDDKDDVKDDVKDEDYVACILVDHGKSLKLGIVDDQGGGVHSVAQSICVPKSTCLGEVAKHFQVEGAYDRGYCDHNPHVRRVTDSECKTLLNKTP